MSASPTYSLRSLTHSYSGRIALDIPHLDIPAGVIWGFVGPNGSGKTTLLSILALLQKASGGSLYLEGIEITPDKSRKLRRKVTLVHQKPILFTGTVRSNVSYGLRVSGFPSKESVARVRAILVEAGLESVADRETPILLLDEPTNSLDDAFRPVLLELLRKANRSRGTTILLATHDLDFVSSIADRVIRIEAGNLLL
jgi:tungstate transport system ATP-binding protein